MLNNDIAILVKDRLEGSQTIPIITFDLAPLNHDVAIGRAATFRVIDGTVGTAHQKVIPEWRDQVVRFHVVWDTRPTPFPTTSTKSYQTVGVEVELSLGYTVKRETESNVNGAGKFIVANQSTVGSGADPVITN